MTNDELNELGAPACVAGRLLRKKPDFLQPCQNDATHKLIVAEDDDSYLVMHLCKRHADLMGALGVLDNGPHS